LSLANFFSLSSASFILLSKSFLLEILEATACIAAPATTPPRATLPTVSALLSAKPPIAEMSLE
jgi:hypothetical protein